MNIPGYSIEETIGEGGMATVYLAVQESLGRLVALKVLKAAQSAEADKRFVNEGRTIASLSHPNIVIIYDIGAVEGRRYISMEFAEGGVLATRIRTGMSTGRTIDVLEQLASALAVIHRKGIVHRDIKPGNILFRSDDTPVLSDFGIAKQVEADLHLTTDGATIGTPYYFSPEQAAGRPLDGRSDIYSLGVVFHEMLTGRKPFKGESAAEVIVAHLTSPVPTLPDAYHRYQDLLDRMLGKQPEERFASAEELQTAVQRVRSGRSGVLEATRTVAVPLTLGARMKSPGERTGIGHRLGRIPADARRLWQERVRPRPLTSALLAGGSLVALVALSRGLIGSKPLDGEGIRPSTAPSEVSRPAAPPAKKATETAALPGQTTRPQREAAQVGENAKATAPGAASHPPQPPARARLQAAVEEQQTRREAVRPAESAVRSFADRQPGGPSAGGLIERYLALGHERLEAYALTTPEGDSAVDYFRKVVEIDPQNEKARTGLLLVADRYADLADQSLRRLRYFQAQRYIRRGLTVDPENQRLLRLAREAQSPTSVPRRIWRGFTSAFD
jgi:serine/threonine-protein kinase PpkA